MQLFYAPDITLPFYELSEDESHHAVRVLRLEVGDDIYLTDGLGNLYCAQITETCKKCVVKIIKTVAEFERRPFQLNIAVAPTKNSERWEWFIEKATETGIDCIVPLNCTHSERRSINVQRSEKVITEAMKQSLKTYRPKLLPMTKFEDFVRNVTGEYKLIAHCRDSERVFIGKTLNSFLPKDVVILIGPEGDFSVEEINLALQNGFTPVSLGTARLRTETAALSAVTIVNYELCELNETQRV